MRMGIGQTGARAAKASRRSPLALILALGLAFLPLLPGSADAQFFGQNKVQYKRFRWSVLRTEHFDIHYYQGTEAAVNDAALMAERAYSRLSRVLNHQIHARVPLVLYASHTDFEQTNITPELLGIGTGGVTEFLKRRVFLPFTGSYAELDHVLTHELVHAFQVDILFGDSQGILGNPFASSIPGWFMEGMAEYLSIGGIDTNTAMWLRDASLEGYLIPVGTLAYVGDIRVYRFGQSIFQFIADKYGIGKIGEILKKTRRLGSMERALESATGLSVDVLSKKWTEAIRKEYLPQIVDHQTPSAIAMKLTDSEHDFSNFNVAASVSPSGLQYVYISDRSMYNDVYLASALDGKTIRKLIEGERTGSFETLRFFNTSIAWSPDEKRIAIPAKVGGEDALYIIDVPSGKVANRYRFGLDAIYSPTWSHDGRRFAFVGLKAGRSALYMVDVSGKNLVSVLNDRYAVRDPVWSPDDSQIAFSTDRGEGTDASKLIFGPLKLAILDMATGNVTVPPGQNGSNISPQWTPDGRSLLFVSDRTGITNIYRMDLATGESVRLTDLLTGVSGLVPESPCLSLSGDGKRLLFTAFARGGWDVYSVREPIKFLEAPPAVEAAPRVAASSLAPLGTRVEANIAASDLPTTGGAAGDPPPGHATGAAPSARMTAVPQGAAHGDSLVAGDPRVDLLLDPPAAHDSSAVAYDSEQSAAHDSTQAAGPGAHPGSVVYHDASRDSSSRPAGSVILTHEPDAPPSAPQGAAPQGAAEHGTAAGASPSPPAATPAVGEHGAPGVVSSETAAPDSTLSDYVHEVYSEPLADSTTFQHLPYRASFSRDYFSGGAVVASNVGFAGSSVISFSDLLGNHNILAILNLYGNISDSDIYIAYTNLARRTNYGLAVFQYQKDLLLFSTPSADDVQNQIHRGVSFFFSRPFTRFRRVEFGMQAAVVDQRVVRYYYTQGQVAQLSNPGDYFYVAPNVGLIADNTLYGSTGPINGGRSRYTVEHAVGGVSYTTGIYDWRRYTNLARRFVLAQRLLGGASFGQDPQYFRFGGAFTYRGVDYGDLVGTRSFIGNLEFRFPLIEQLRTGFPMSISLGGVNGVLFLDGASAWNADSDPVFFSNRGGFHTENFRLAFGFGARINLGYFILRYDYAREHRINGGLGEPRHFFAFGPEF